MKYKNIINIAVSLLALLLIVLTAVKYCGRTEKHFNESAAIQLYKDSLEFIRGSLDLQENKTLAQTVRVSELEKTIDSLLIAHKKTKTKLKPAAKGDLISDTGFVLAPNEYVNECEHCFKTLATYKAENTQLKFERDSYDTLMRAQARVQEKMISDLEADKMKWNKLYNNCITAARNMRDDNEVTRKGKISGAGGALNGYLPNVFGGGFIYEDKKFNEYGIHFLNLGKHGNMVLFHAAKTISFKRKK